MNVLVQKISGCKSLAVELCAVFQKQLGQHGSSRVDEGRGVHGVAGVSRDGPHRVCRLWRGLYFAALRWEPMGGYKQSSGIQHGLPCWDRNRVEGVTAEQESMRRFLQ